MLPLNVPAISATDHPASSALSPECVRFTLDGVVGGGVVPCGGNGYVYTGITGPNSCVELVNSPAFFFDLLPRGAFPGPLLLGSPYVHTRSRCAQLLHRGLSVLHRSFLPDTQSVMEYIYIIFLNHTL